MELIDRLNDIMTGIGLMPNAYNASNRKEFLETILHIEQKGHASRIDCLTLVQKGFNIAVELSIFEQKTQGRILSEITTEGISFERIKAAIINCTDVGGKFHNLFKLEQERLCQKK
ncbi:MAG: hypothetical protein BGO31_14250 [Bacteroidetes bacterium 43-16]|nr:MAG: hypothetical protein BGO31_14250 [Bacteroidetes bacterium 43-16]